MRVGLIVEGIPDAKVCEYLARRLSPGLEIETVPLGGKPRLRKRCGQTAKLLLDEGCDRVVIVWDLYPADWQDPDYRKSRRKRKTRPSCTQDRQFFESALGAASVDLQHVCLVCINAMLETWLLSDIRAVNTVLSSRTRRSTVKDPPHLDRNQDPKSLMINIFRQEGRGRNARYSDVDHAIRIAEAIPPDSRDLNRLRKFHSFEVFERCVST